jgi:hypothetical protein
MHINMYWSDNVFTIMEYTLELIKSLNGPYIQCHSYWYGAY